MRSRDEKMGFPTERDISSVDRKPLALKVELSWSRLGLVCSVDANFVHTGAPLLLYVYPIYTDGGITQFGPTGRVAGSQCSPFSAGLVSARSNLPWDNLVFVLEPVRQVRILIRREFSRWIRRWRRLFAHLS